MAGISVIMISFAIEGHQLGIPRPVPKCINLGHQYSTLNINSTFRTFAF